MLKICIAGKNSCAIQIVKFLIKKQLKKSVIILPNKTDKGDDNWQPSLRKFAKKNKLKIVKKDSLYSIKNLIFLSIEYEEILKTKKFLSKELFNIHFSLLPRYRGCHTNYLQIKNGEKKSGVTLHKIDKGIDTGDIIDQISFNVPINSNGIDNYKKLMSYSVKIFKKNYFKILKKTYSHKKQTEKRATYFSRKYVNYTKEKMIKKIINSKKFHDEIRALIFPPLQFPILDNKEIIKTTFKNNKIYLKFND